MGAFPPWSSTSGATTPPEANGELERMLDLHHDGKG